MSFEESWCCPLSFRETRRNDIITNSITNYVAIYLHMCPNDDFWEFQKALDIEGNHLLGKTCQMKDLYAQQHEHDSNTCSTITVIGLSCSVYINRKQDHACKTMSPKSLQFMNLPQFWHRGHSLWCILVGNSKSGPMHEKGIRSCIPYSTECSCFSTPFPQIPFPCMYSTYIHVQSNIYLNHSIYINVFNHSSYRL